MELAYWKRTFLTLDIKWGKLLCCTSIRPAFQQTFFWGICARDFLSCSTPWSMRCEVWWGRTCEGWLMLPNPGITSDLWWLCSLLVLNIKLNNLSTFFMKKLFRISNLGSLNCDIDFKCSKGVFYQKLLLWICSNGIIICIYNLPVFAGIGRWGKYCLQRILYSPKEAENR